jgi:hypothetical protein
VNLAKLLATRDADLRAAYEFSEADVATS